MAKTSKQADKKSEQKLINVLTELCEQFKIDVDGFNWLTHIGKFPSAPLLKVVCIFDFEHELEQAKQDQLTVLMSKQITDAVNQLRLALNNTEKSSAKKLAHNNIRVSFDSEESCSASHGGDWSLRLAARFH